MVNLVDRAAIAAHDWSLTPARNVGVAPEWCRRAFEPRGRCKGIVLLANPFRRGQPRRKSEPAARSSEHSWDDHWFGFMAPAAWAAQGSIGGSRTMADHPRTARPGSCGNTPAPPQMAGLPGHCSAVRLAGRSRRRSRARAARRRAGPRRRRGGASAGTAPVCGYLPSGRIICTDRRRRAGRRPGS